VSFRKHRHLRTLARRLPIIGQYERRIAELTAQVHRLQTWVPIGHYYSPFVDLDGLATSLPLLHTSDPVDIPAVDLRIAEQRALLAELRDFASSIKFSQTEAEAREQGHRYWADNPAYGDSDARFLTAVLHHFRPARLIELGCGYSSAVTLDARDRFLDFDLSVTFVDPYPQLLESLVRESDGATLSIMPVGTQDVDLDLIRQLDANDVLFIDSTHVSKTWSDVNRIFFEILPALRPGVLVHLHDIFLRFEYPLEWVMEQRAWTEQYILRAFLEFNSKFEILLWPNLLAGLDPVGLFTEYPMMASNAGAAFWMRKVA
jgi:hypothetical protein